MNRYLRQLFTAVVVLFVILGLSSTVFTAIRANELNNDSRNTRALYHELGSARGAILASDGSIIAESTPTNDAFGYQRTYHDGAVYAPITGYFSVVQKADRGLEASSNALLSGESDALFWQRMKSLLTGSTTKGASIETSINPKLQQLAYSLLGNNEGSVVAMEPSTGRILAMVSTPSYDPSQLATHDTAKANEAYQSLVNDASNPMLDRATSQLFPPGSTFKMVVAAAACESGNYQPDTMIPAGASYTLPGTSTNLTNAEPAGDGTDNQISLENAIAYSSNTAFAQLGVTLGDEAISEQAKKLGYDAPITIDGTGSSAMRAVASQFPTGQSADKLALASIGQGDTLSTPLQNAMVASAIANGGRLMYPTLVDRVRSSDLTEVAQTQPTLMSEAFSKDTADKLTQMMQAVVTKDATNLQISGVSVAAKTGTAQIGASNEANDAWVIGFAPADNPKIAISVVVHNVNTYGAAVAGPIMKALLEEALRQ